MPERLIGLSEICSLTGMDKSALNRYLLAPNEKNRAIFGGEETHPKYPESSLTAFHALKKLHEEKRVTPQTLAGLWSVVRNSESGELSESERGIRTSDNLPAVRQQAELTAPVWVEESAQAIIRYAPLFADALRLSGVVEDRLLTRAQAAEVLACSPLAVGRYVRAVRKNVWRMSDLQKYIRGLGK